MKSCYLLPARLPAVRSGHWFTGVCPCRSQSVCVSVCVCVNQSVCLVYMCLSVSLYVYQSVCQSSHDFGDTWPWLTLTFDLESYFNTLTRHPVWETSSRQEANTAKASYISRTVVGSIFDACSNATRAIEVKAASSCVPPGRSMIFLITETLDDSWEVPCFTAVLLIHYTFNPRQPA